MSHYTVETKPLFITWKNIHQRCSNPNRPDYKYYGGRGVKVCKRWDSFTLFLEDMGERPEGYSIDRTDNSKDYSPDNCRWASKHTQMANRRNNHEIVGVRWIAKDSLWIARLAVDKKLVLNRQFKVKADAIEARKEAEKRWLGSCQADKPE